MTEQGVSPAAARQRITRAQSDYKRLAGLRFAKNARFIYLDDQYGNHDFWDAIERAFKSSGPSYWGAVVGLKARGGRCPKSLFPSICGAPLARSRQLSPERILERLEAIQLLEEEFDDVSDQSFIQFRPHGYPKSPDALIKATLLAEYVALHSIRDWARRIGFGSYGKFRMRDDLEPPIVSGITWDLSAPSYMRPLTSVRKGSLRPGFFICDINLNGPIGEDLVALFVRKHDMASAPINVAPILPFLVGEVFTQDAFDLARQAGITATTIADLFGKETAKALRDLIGLLSNAGATAAVNPDHLYQVMTALTKIEGAANNLRGALFELAIGSLVKDIEDGYLLTGQTRKDYSSGRSAEIDVLLNRPDGIPVLVIECKSKIPGARVTRDEVEKWYSDRVPLIYNILSADPRFIDRTFQFELWSNGPFDAKALEWLTSKDTEFGAYSVGWKDGEMLKEYAKEASSGTIRKMLNEHYFLHPLTKLSKKRSPQRRKPIVTATP